MKSNADLNASENLDPITKAPGAHPVGTGIGAAAGGMAGIGGAVAVGAATGTIAGPVGAVVGAAVGAVVGGLIGKEIAEEVNPTLEHEYWRSNFLGRPYVRPGTSYDDYGPAYQLGWEGHGRYAGKAFEDVEEALQREWDAKRGHSSLDWEYARDAARDSWKRVESPVGTLNHLIETLEDGSSGFETAAGGVKDPRVKTIFRELSQQRSRLASELQAEVRRIGGEPETSGSPSGWVHRGWMDLKKAMGGGEKSILNEAERGEDVAVKMYEKALQANLPADIADVVRRQYDDVRRAHDRIRDLRDAWK